MSCLLDRPRVYQVQYSNILLISFTLWNIFYKQLTFIIILTMEAEAQGLFQSARDTITKYHRVGGLNNKHLFSHTSRGWKSEGRVPARLDSGESPLLAFRKLPFSCLLIWPFFSACMQRERALVPFSKALIPSQWPHHYATSKPNYLPKVPRSNIIIQGLGLQYMNLGAKYSVHKPIKLLSYGYSIQQQGKC